MFTSLTIITVFVFAVILAGAFGGAMPRGATLTDHVCAPSNGIQAAVYDCIGPAIAVHDRQ